MANIVDLIKQAALEITEMQKNMIAIAGTVLNTSPLTIQVDQKLTLEQDELVLLRTVKNYQTQIYIPNYGTQSCTVKNELAAGDTVLLLRWQGGQKYIVLDKVDDEE